MIDIAIVGLDCRFPQATDADALWRLLMAGGDGIVDVPEDRWHPNDFYNEAGGPGAINNCSGGFLSDADAFDHEFFGIAPARPRRWTRSNACSCRRRGVPSRTPLWIRGAKPVRTPAYSSA